MLNHCCLCLFGQMNVADSERLAGALDAAGYTSTTDSDVADVLVSAPSCVLPARFFGGNYGRPSHSPNKSWEIKLCMQHWALSIYRYRQSFRL